MSRGKKVVLGVAVAVLLLAVGYGAWTIRPLETTTTTRREGHLLVTETRTRVYRLRAPLEWSFYWFSGRPTAPEPGACLTNEWLDGVGLGILQVTDVYARNYAPATE